LPGLIGQDAGDLRVGDSMSATYSGNYPIERRAGEIERLNIQSKAMAPDTLAMLGRFGPMEGWACLDVGCGPGGITDLLSARVGRAGRVIGLDMDEEFLEYARRSAPTNVEFRRGDAYDADLPAGSFDLVHMPLSQALPEVPIDCYRRRRAWYDRAALLLYKNQTGQRLTAIRHTQRGTG